MSDKKDSDKSDKTKWKIVKKGGEPGAIYGLGFVGAAVYYVQQATTFWGIVLGILKAFFWPAFLIFKVFTLLKM